MALINQNLTAEQKLMIQTNNQQVVLATDKKYLKNRVHVSETTLAPAIAGKPTLTEIQTFVTSYLTTHPLDFQATYYYTGTNTPSDTVIETYLVDKSGIVTPAMLQTSSSVTAQYVGSSATYGGLPTTRQDTTALFLEDRAALTKDVKGTGTKANPQYPAGMYFWDGSAWTLGYRFDSTRDADLLLDWTASTDYLQGETLLINGEIYISNSERTSGATLDATELTNFTRVTFQPNARVFADDTTVAPAIAGKPTLAEIQTFVTAGALIDTLVYYTGTDINTDAPTYVYMVDANADVTLVQEPSSGSANNRWFVDDTTLAPANPGFPTDAEFQAYATTNNVTDTTMFYTGTDVDTDAITHVYLADASGTVTLVLFQPPAGTPTVIPLKHGSIDITADFTLNSSINIMSGVVTGTGAATTDAGVLDWQYEALMFSLNGLVMVQDVDFTIDYATSEFTFINASMLGYAGDYVYITQIRP